MRGAGRSGGSPEALAAGCPGSGRESEPSPGAHTLLPSARHPFAAADCDHGAGGAGPSPRAGVSGLVPVAGEVCGAWAEEAALLPLCGLRRGAAPGRVVGTAVGPRVLQSG